MEDDTFKRILQDKQFHLQIKAEQKEIIQMCWKEKIQWQSVTNGLGKEYVLRPPFLDKAYYIIFFFSYGYICICNSLLLLKSLLINIINCIKFYVNCSALTGTYDWQ
jgi:hypothetical protein